MNRKIKGDRGESLAVKILELKDYKILEKNYRKRIGEIDLIALDEDIIVFVEVKSRYSLNFGHPRDAVNKSKQNKIIKTSLLYIQENNIHDRQFRYDVIEIYFKDKRYNLIKNAFNL